MWRYGTVGRLLSAIKFTDDMFGDENPGIEAIMISMGQTKKKCDEVRWNIEEARTWMERKVKILYKEAAEKELMVMEGNGYKMETAVTYDSKRMTEGKEQTNKKKRKRRVHTRKMRMAKDTEENELTK